MRTNPCKGCVPPKRTSTCHAECEAYLKWQKERNEELDAIRQQKIVNGALRNLAKRHSRKKRK